MYDPYPPPPPLPSPTVGDLVKDRKKWGIVYEVGAAWVEVFWSDGAQHIHSLNKSKLWKRDANVPGSPTPR